MGCNQSQNCGTFDLAKEYDRKTLPAPDPKLFQNEFEKEAFMIINLIRADPKGIIPQIRAIKSHSFYKGQPIQPLIEHL